jgi:hypothetical protein
VAGAPHQGDDEFGHRKRVAEIKHKAWERDYAAVLGRVPRPTLLIALTKYQQRRHAAGS